jgi:hypothetical protein
VSPKKTLNQYETQVSHRWLDETPTARIIARCTQDIRAIDGPVPEALATLIELGITLLTKLVVVIIFTPIFAFPTMVVTICGFFLGNLYLRAQLSVKREMRYVSAMLPETIPFTILSSNARSPLLAHFSAAIAGIGNVHLFLILSLIVILLWTSFNSRIQCSGSFQNRVAFTGESLHPRRSNVL